MFKRRPVPRFSRGAIVEGAESSRAAFGDRDPIVVHAAGPGPWPRRRRVKPAPQRTCIPANFAGRPDVANAIYRARVYGLLAEVFCRKPNAELLRHLRLPPFVEALEQAGASLGGDFLDRPEGELLGELAAAYEGLFVGPGRQVSPRASAHLAAAGEFRDASPSEITNFIEAAGFAYGTGDGNPPDHLSVELDFMRYLVDREARTLEKADDAKAEHCREIEEEIVTGHLALWVPVFCAKVAARTDSPFYREMAALLADFIKFEAEILALDRPQTAIRTGTNANQT